MPDPYELQDLLARIETLLADEKPVEAVVAIAAAHGLDLYDLADDWQEAVDASA